MPTTYPAVRRALRSPRSAALFAEGRQARDAAARVVRDARLPEKRVEVVGPGDTAVERKLEPEASGIARTLVRAHVVMGTLACSRACWPVKP